MVEMLDRSFTADQIEDAFAHIGIKELTPGFYDEPAFLQAERREPLLLEVYAAYVRCRPYTPAYLDHAREVITSAATFISNELIADGRKGACIDASGILGRFLEKEGVWNFVAKGGLTTDYPKGSGLPRGYFAPIHNTPGLAAGHAWLIAPPFQLVDLTLRQQPYKDGQERYLPDTVFATAVEPATSEAADWIDPDLYPGFVRQYGRRPTMKDVAQMVGASGMASAKRLGTAKVRVNGATLKYVTTGVMAGDQPLEKARNLVLRGVGPFELYQKWKATRPVS
jgi:hypothetical protein